MKLKRLLCALVVFTLMMTSVVCSVSAATYQTTTVYNVSSVEGDLGSISLKTSVYGLTEGSMVSYIIYEGSSVAEDGSNIEYIDQQTADSTGTIEFGTDAKFEGKSIDGMAYTFASSGNEHADATYKTIMNTAKDAADTKSDAFEIGENVSYSNYFILFHADTEADYYANVDRVLVDYYGYNRAKLAEINSSVDMADYSWPIITEGSQALNNRYMPCYPGSTVTFTVTPADGYKATSFKLLAKGTNYSGGDVNRAVKDYSDYLNFGKIKIDLAEESDYFTLGNAYDIYSIATEAVDSTTTKYIKIDGKPVYVSDEDNGTESVTFLMTKSDAIADTDEYGVNIYAYPAGSDVAEKCFTGAKAYNVTGDKFGIQLYATADNENAKYFDSDAYDLVAIPYINGVELASNADDLFYIVDSNTDLSGGSFNVVE